MHCKITHILLATTLPQQCYIACSGSISQRSVPPGLPPLPAVMMALPAATQPKKEKNFMCTPLFCFFTTLFRPQISQFTNVWECRVVEHQNVETMMINNSSGLVNSGTAARKFRWGFSGRFCRRMWQLMCRCVDAALLLGEPGALQRVAACDAATLLLCS